MEADRIERIEQLFKKRYRIKKLANLLISAVIVLLGVTSFVFIWSFDRDGVLTFRWMTVDGTVFTTVIAFLYIAMNILEIARYTELTSRIVYYMRLASAVAESLIMVVVLLSQLPVSPQHMHILRYDMFNMHLVIPILTVVSFITNDSPIGKQRFRKLWHGTWFVTLYAAVVLTLIFTGVIPQEMIPYAFMDFAHMPALAILACFVFIYGMGILLSFCLYRWNRKLSWLWFKDVAARKTAPRTAAK